MATTSYVPGVCNINPAEVSKRRRVGFIGLALALVVFVVLIALGAPDWTGVLVAIPAWGAATGLLQAANHFCVAHAAHGTQLADASLEPVADERARAKDKARARTLNLQALGLGLLAGIVTAVVLGLS